MNKKGFTLVELLAAITILAVIALITTTTVTNFLKNGKEDLYQKQLNNIKLAAKTWASDNKEKLKGTDCYSLTLKQLQDSNYVDSNIANPSDGEKLDNEKIIVNITKEGKTYKYEINDTAKYCPVEFVIGDTVNLFGDDYYAIEDSDKSKNYVTLLKADPLTVEEVNKYGEGHINNYAQFSINTAYNINGYGGVAYYTSENCKRVFSACYYDYEHSDVKYVVDNWSSNVIEDKNLVSIDNYKARLVTFDEYSNLENLLPILFSSGYRYWTMTQTNREIYFIGSDWSAPWRKYGSSTVTYPELTIRPVINIKKSALKGGSNNE